PPPRSSSITAAASVEPSTLPTSRAPISGRPSHHQLASPVTAAVTTILPVLWDVADGVHLRHPLAARAGQARRLGLIVTMPVHGNREARRARRAKADVAFISPLHATHSHPGAPALGRAAWLRLARLAGGQAIALGGMTPARARQLKRASGFNPGWAAIDAWEEKAAKRRRKNA
uniref:thiamine phosphate synthase n=1 Tax=Sphingopyxis sp. TaxID=1908224 RepID=UPI0035B15E82